LCVMDEEVLLCGGAHRMLWMEQFCCVEKHTVYCGWNSSSVWRSTLCILMELFCCMEEHTLYYGWNSSVSRSTLCVMDGIALLLCGERHSMM
jgi:hypothetical protein